MARNSFSMKAASTTVTAAVAVIALNTDEPVVALGGLPIVALFWVLDAVYLRQERAFRHLYDRVRVGAPEQLGAQDYFAMVAEPARGTWRRVADTAGSMRAATLIFFYLALLLLLGGAAVVAV